MKRILLLFSLVIFSCNMYSYNMIKCQNPQTWNQQTNCKISDASLQIYPKGIFYHCILEFSFTPLNYAGAENDSLEMYSFFDFPERTAITNSWLLIGDEYVEAGHYDVSIAKATYEDIVDRRKDPSILYKKSATQYELRVYPIMPNETRKVKIEYMLPIRQTREKSMIDLPLGLLNAAEQNTGIDIKLYGHNSSQTPYLNGSSTYEMNLIDGMFHKKLSSTESQNISFIQFDKHYEAQYQTYTENEQESYFILNFNPAIELGITSSKKDIIILDYDEEGTDYTKKEVITALKSSITDHYRNQDSILIKFNTSNGIVSTSNELKDVATTLSLLDDLIPSLGNSSDIVELIENALDNDLPLYSYHLVIFSSTTKYKGYYDKEGMEILNDIFKAHPDIPEVYAYSFSNATDENTQNQGSWWWWYSPYQWNYFLSQLTQKTGGKYSSTSYYTNQIDAGISNLFTSIKSNKQQLQVYPVQSNGDVYELYTWNEKDADLNNDYVIVGKYTGAIAPKIHVTAVHNEVVYSTILSSATKTTNPYVKKSWVASVLKYYEQDYYYLSASDKNYILKLSLDNRILSNSTAFLALEPGMEVLDPDIINDETTNWFPTFITADIAVSPVMTTSFTGAETLNIIDTPSEEGDDEIEEQLITIYPSPATTEINFNIPENFISARVVDITGKTRKTFEEGNQLMNWNLEDDNGKTLSTGLYIFQCEVGGYTLSKSFMVN